MSERRKPVKSKADRVLTVIFAALIVVNLSYLVLGFLSIPAYYERVTTLTIQEIQVPGANFPSNESVKQSAAAQNLTLERYAALQIVFHSAIVLLFIATAAVIVFRAGRNWYAWYSAFFLVFIAEYAFYNEVYIARLLPLWVYDSGALFWPLILPFLFLFPNGKPAPPQALWLVIPTFVLHVIFQTAGFFLLLTPEVASLTFFESVVEPFQNGRLVAGVFLFILGCQVYRFLRVSTREEKQQTKWFLVGFAFSLALDLVSEALGDANPYRSEVGLAIFAFVPVSLGVAILRYRLWDIDLIIRRTLQYSLLTGLLSLVYFGGVALLSAFGGQSSPFVIVLTTLLVAALFNPLRRRIQDFIDRRFYRQKYDAEKALAEFAAAARSGTDLEQLSAHLTTTVRQALQPDQTTLWLKGMTHVETKKFNSLYNEGQSRRTDSVP